MNQKARTKDNLENGKILFYSNGKNENHNSLFIAFDMRFSHFYIIQDLCINVFKNFNQYISILIIQNFNQYILILII